MSRLPLSKFLSVQYLPILSEEIGWLSAIPVQPKYLIPDLCPISAINPLNPVPIVNIVKLASPLLRTSISTLISLLHTRHVTMTSKISVPPLDGHNFRLIAAAAPAKSDEDVLIFHPPVDSSNTRGRLCDATHTQFARHPTAEKLSQKKTFSSFAAPIYRATKVHSSLFLSPIFHPPTPSPSTTQTAETNSFANDEICSQLYPDLVHFIICNSASTFSAEKFLNHSLQNIVLYISIVCHLRAKLLVLRRSAV